MMEDKVLDKQTEEFAKQFGSYIGTLLKESIDKAKVDAEKLPPFLGVDTLEYGETKNENLQMIINKNDKTVSIKGLKKEMTYIEFAKFKDLLDTAMDQIPKEETHVLVVDANIWLPRY